MTRIIQGVFDFQRRIFGKKRDLFEQLGKGQQPLALFITCSDSRINPNLLSQTEPGELFVLRNAGNLVPPHGTGNGAEAATIEYALVQLRIREIILCGHARCGAIHGLLEPQALTKLPSVVGWLEYAKPILDQVPEAGLTLDQRLAQAIQKNVLLQLEHLKTHPSVKAALEARAVRLHGWVYHFEQGKVEAYDPLSGNFVPLEQQVRPKWHPEVKKDQDPRTEWETHI